jgi:protoporphyrinogen oxidase
LKERSLYRQPTTGILGGGLSGLSVGYFLNQISAPFRVLEQQKACGGLMKTHVESNFAFDCAGSHIIFSKNPTVLRFLLSLIGSNACKRRRNTKVLFNGCFVKYPFENGLSDLPKEDNYECLYFFIKNLVEKSRGTVQKPVNLREWFYYNFGKGIAEKYLIPYNEKIWKFPTNEMGLDWVERIPDPPMEDILKSSLGIETEGYTHQLYFYYPKLGGIQTIIRLLESEIHESVTVGFEVKRVKREDGAWCISNGKSELFFDKIVSTIPVQQLVLAVAAP